MNLILVNLEKVATILSSLSIPIIFTGGATIPLYLESLSAIDIRPTDDVDCVVEITTRSAYYQLAEKLRNIGLQESIETNSPLCRWLYNDIIIDIIPSEELVLGFTNSWYKPGIGQAITYYLPSGRPILIFSSPYFLASKIEAFQSRGKANFYYSTDFEDIVTLLDGCASLEVELKKSDPILQNFVSNWFAKNLSILIEVAPPFLSPIARNSGRTQLLIDRIKRLI